MRNSRSLLVTLTAMISLCLGSAVFAEQPSKARSSEETVRIHIQPVARCRLGDLNLIANEVVRDLPERRRIIATIEAIPGDPSFAASRSDQLLTLEQSTPHTFLAKSFVLRVPSLAETTIAGLYVCKDGDNKGTCSDKSIEPFETMIAEHEVPLDRIDSKTGQILGSAAPAPQPDRTYYFAPVIIKNGTVNLLEGIKTFADLEKELRRYSPQRAPSESYIHRAVEAVGSLFPKKQGNGLMIELPYNDAKRCNEAAPTK